jgi:hypothetical protein
MQGIEEAQSPFLGRFSASPVAQAPASQLLFVLYALLVVAFSLLIDRSFLMDQQNYIDNFSEAATLDWLRAWSEEESLLRGAITQLFSEELLWRIWTTLLGLTFDPATAVLLTVCVLNGLLILAAWRSDGPSLALALWLIVPVGFAVTGLLQLRQGFGFAVMLYIAMRWRSPIVAALIAGMIHTTFAVAFVFAVVAWVFRSRPWLALLAVVALAFSGAYAGGVLFEMFGGRRLLTYSTTEGVTSINYVFGGLLCILPSLYWLMTTSRIEQQLQESRILSSLALIHVGATAFTLFSFFLFPLGAGRIGYLTQLLLIPLLPSLRQRRHHPAALAIFGLLMLYLVYLTGKSYVEGVYEIYFGT